MPAPTQLSIATSVLHRLVKEEASYRREYAGQQARITKLQTEQSEDENAEYTLRQERKALDETSAMFPRLKTDIEAAKTRLEDQLEKHDGSGNQSSSEEVTKAKEAITAAHAATEKAAQT